MAKTVVGLFDDYSDAQAAIRDMEKMGFSRDEVSIVANDRAGTPGMDYDTATGETVDAAATGAGTGAVAGTAIGGTVGLLGGLGALAIPGFGPILAAGPLIAAITGAGIGAATGAAAGGLIGALTEAGVPETEAGYYQEGVRRGGTLVTVSTDDHLADQVVEVMNRHNVVDIDRRGQDYRAAGLGTGASMGYASSESDFTTGRNNAGLGYSTGHNPNNPEELGADADLSGAGAAVNHGYSGINNEPPSAGGYASGSAGQVTNATRQPDYNEANADNLDRVAHQRMPSRDDMSSTIPGGTVTDEPLSDDEELGDTDRDLKRNRPGESNIY